MTLARIRHHFVNWREWEFNPIVIKELRQAVRSWTITGVLLLFLSVLFITALVIVINDSSNSTPDMALGMNMFSAFSIILTGVCVFFIPLYIGARIGLERQDNNHDLLYVSTLSPGRIIRGKWLCGVIIALLFISACAPFMAFTNLLRGVDLPTMFYILFYLFLTICAATMIAIFMACLPVTRAFKILLALYGIFQSFGLIMPLLAFGFFSMRSGVGSSMGTHDFWQSIFGALGITAIITGFFYVLSVALISPPSANRAVPIRVYLTSVWIITGLLAVVCFPAAKQVWAAVTLFLSVLAAVIVVSNSDHLSRRVRRTIPARGWKRLLALLFYNGAAGGLIWIGLIVALTVVVSSWPMNSYSSSPGGPPDMERLATLIIYSLAYCLTALWIHRRFFPRRPAKFTGLLAVCLAGGWSVLPGIVLFLFNRLNWRSMESFHPGSIGNAFFEQNPGLLERHLLFASVWLLGVLLLNLRWFGEQVRNFCPMPAEAPPILPPVIP